MYGNLPIQCTYEDEYNVRTELSRNVRFWQKKLKKCTVRTVRIIEGVFKKDDFINIATYLRIGVKICVIYLDFGT